jgi:nitrate/nitrite-specific signal transduction histidine kinase
VVCYFRDISDQIRAREILRESQNRLRALTDTLEAQVQVRTEELEQQPELLRKLSQTLMQAQDDERRRIARELDDSVGQILSALGMNLGTVAQHAKQSAPQLVSITDEGQKLVQQLDQEIRTMSYLLHPPLLDESGLAQALRWYVRGLKERSGLVTALSIPEGFGRLSREMELAMFRVVQGCLTNVHPLRRLASHTSRHPIVGFLLGWHVRLRYMSRPIGILLCLVVDPLESPLMQKQEGGGVIVN